MLGRSFQNASIRNKFRVLVLAISVVAVVGSCLVFIIYLWFSVRTALVRRQETMASIIAEQSTAALEFDQPDQGTTILRTLKAEHQIVAAALYTRKGKLFASYLREGSPPAMLFDRADSDGQRFLDGDLLNFHPVQSGGERVGTLYVRSDLSDLRARVYVVIGTAFLVLFGASLTVYGLSTKFGGLITGPVLRLSQVAQQVTQKKDYSVRVDKGGQDEMGKLIEGFNEMLAQIQIRDGALAAARDDLEKRVLERTQELEIEIRERKEAEAQLHEKDARLLEAQEIARLGSWEWNLSSDKVSWSDEVYRISGVMPTKFAGTLTAFLNIVHPDDRGAFKETMDAACRKREPLAADFRIFRPDGSVRHLHAQGKVILGEDGRPLRLAATLQDITERKIADQSILDLNRELQARMTELAAANQELEGFSYSVSHDLRAPLRSIDGYSRMLIEDFGGQVQGDARRYLDTIVEGTRRMGQLIDDLLSFSKMGRKALETSPIDMGNMVQEVVAELRQQNPDRALEFRVGKLPQTVGDPAMMRQVWTNLVSNAVKYSRGREPAVIEVGAREDQNEVTYFVKDNGVGFDMEFVHKLFGVFQRLHSSKEFEGTGVGLALVQRIIQRHGGRVRAESKIGDGAIFSMALPKNRNNGA